MVKGNPKSGDKINRIKEVLEEQGRTQRWLAKETDKAPGTVANFCNNLTQPHLADLKEIALLLNVNIKDLLYDTPVK
ncbi:MAG: helix-turn-helix transcriptional regulator [Bacteroidia bacterium]|nr:helix-turn-helix transcriptional regulator [Bacteroidia bacterium]